MRVTVRLTPNASRDEIAGWMDDGTLRVKVQSPPVDGAANKRLIVFMAGIIGVSKSKVRIVTGVKSRTKTLEIPVEAGEFYKRLKEVS